MAIHGGGDEATPPPPAGPCPWLVYYHGKGDEKQTFCCDISGPSPVKTYRKNIPALRGKKVVSCSYGWLVLYDVNTKLLSLCNSTTFEGTITLPRLHQLSNYEIDSCVLLPSCRNDNFKVLLFLENFRAIMCYWVGSDCREWRELRYWKQLKALLPKVIKQLVRDNGPVFFVRAIACGGKIYAQLGAEWSVYYHHIWYIEIVEEEEPVGLVLSRLNVPGGREWWFRTNVYLLESCGELFVSYFVGGNVAFEVYRMNFDSMVWERMKKVEDRAFFVGERYCLSCRASGSGVIYFTKSMSLYCYYIHDDSVSLSQLRSSLPMSCPSSPTWIMPQVREDDHFTHDNSNSQGRNSTITRFKLGLDENREEEQPCSLPLDVLELVSRHITGLDYMNFRAVSRFCRSIAPPVDWRRAIFESETDCPNFPLLMLPDKDHNLWKFVDPRNHNSSNNHYMMSNPNSLGDHNVIRYSQCGYLLLSGSDALHLYHPFMGDILSCHSRTEEISNSLFFLKNPSCEATLVSVGFRGTSGVVVSTIDFGAEEWMYCELPSYRIFEGATHASPVLFQDAFYYMDRKGYLGKLEIDLVEDLAIWEVLEKPQIPAFIIDSFHENFLVECCGKLISVFVGPVGKWIVVYMLNDDNQAWEIVTDLGDYDLYLSATSSFSAPTTSSGGNRIYFPILRGSEIVYFSLETGKWHFSGSQDESLDLYGARMHLNSCWIKPTRYPRPVMGDYYERAVLDVVEGGRRLCVKSHRDAAWAEFISLL